MGQSTTQGMGQTTNPQDSTVAEGAYDITHMDLSTALKGNTSLTVNVSKAQGETLADHSLVFYKIGEYLPHGNSAITVSAPTQNVENALYNFLTAEASAGGLKEAFPNASYTSADGEALNWLLTSNYLGSDATGQNLSMQSDNAVRLLANYLYSNDHSIGWESAAATHGTVSNNNGYQEETYTLPNPGIYLVVDSTNNGNTAMPMIVSTVATGDTAYTGPLTQYMTSQIGLKTQDPQATPVKQFVKDPQTSTATGTADITGTLTNSMTASVGSANADSQWLFLVRAILKL